MKIDAEREVVQQKSLHEPQHREQQKICQFSMHFVIRFNLRAPPAAACSGSLPVRAAPARPVPETPEHTHLRNSPEHFRSPTPEAPQPCDSRPTGGAAPLSPCRSAPARAPRAQVGIAHQDHVAQGRKVRREPHRHRVGRASFFVHLARFDRADQDVGREVERESVVTTSSPGREKHTSTTRPSSPAAGRCRPTKSNRNSPYLQCGRWHGTPY